MHLLYNGQLLAENQLHLPLSNRAFQYNDGFFETIIVENGRLRFWQDHHNRMQEAAGVLQLQLPQPLQSPAFSEVLLQLAQQNRALEYGRLKLKVWRGGAGLYTPETAAADWLATAQPATKPTPAVLEVGVCRQVQTSFSPFSFFKGPHALVYVMAGIEKKARGTHDMLLLSKAGHVAELISANLFWLKGTTCYTPSLATGCVNGIVRRNVLRWCHEAGIAVQEVQATLQDLAQADAVVAANVTGFKSIAAIDGAPIATSHPLVNWLAEKFEQA